MNLEFHRRHLCNILLCAVQRCIINMSNLNLQRKMKINFHSFQFNVFHLFQDELGCRVDFLLDRCFQAEREEMETMENVNRLLLQNVLPLHVASFFIGKTIRNQVTEIRQSLLYKGDLVHGFNRDWVLAYVSQITAFTPNFTKKKMPEQ